jgi:hypothetical protein
MQVIRLGVVVPGRMGMVMGVCVIVGHQSLLARVDQRLPSRASL